MAVPAYVPFSIASDDFLVAKFCQLIAAGRVPPRTLVEELEKRGLLNEALKHAKAAIKAIPSESGNGFRKLGKLQQLLELLPGRDARELASRIAIFSNPSGLSVDGKAGDADIIVFRATLEYVEGLVRFGDDYQYLKVPVDAFTPQ